MVKKEQQDLHDRLWLGELARQDGMGGRLVRRFLHHWPDPGFLRHAKLADLTGFAEGVNMSRLQSVLADQRWQQKAAYLAERALQAGIRAVCCTDPEYPDRLAQIGGCPLVLYYLGLDLAKVLTSDYYLTLVGTRTPTDYGRHMTEQIAADLAREGVVVISGLARGIDAIAHRTVLANNGLTIAVTGCGLDRCYPPEHASLQRQIAAQGLVVSEFPPGTPPLACHFPARNRILSGMADAVAVVEAARRSGTMITAGFAADQGRDVFAVPGSVLSTFSQGCNQLIADGAFVLQSSQDLIWRLPSASRQIQIRPSVANTEEPD